jgi:hypothetical protein
MRILNGRSDAGSTARSWKAGAVVALLTCVGLVACTGAETPSLTSSVEAGAVSPLPNNGDLDAGTYLATGFTVPFEVTVPDGWGTRDGANLFKDEADHPGERGVFLTFWPVHFVPSDACAWRGAFVQLDPTVQSFVNAMAAQTSAVTTTPIEVVVGDYSGLEFDHSVESGVDIPGCDDGRLCVHSDQAQECARWYSDLGERETYRAVDLNGERAVIAVGQSHQSIDPALTKEARAVFDSIVFLGSD